MLYHQGDYIQRGRGIGSIFHAIARSVYPAIATLGKLGKSALTSSTASSLLQKVKNSAIDAGINVASDTLAGKNVGQSILTNLAGIATGAVVPKTAKKSKEKKKQTKKPKAKKAKPAVKRKVKGKNTSPKKPKYDDIYDDSA
jgi:hypothetical protein